MLAPKVVIKERDHARCEIIAYVIKSREIIEDLETQFDEKCKIEREDAMEKASLENALEEEQELRVSLEEKLESLDESNDLIIAKIIEIGRASCRERVSSPV